MNNKLSIEQLEIIGSKIAFLLNVEPIMTDKDGNIRYDTSYGTKTNIGLARTVLGIVEVVSDDNIHFDTY